MRSRMFALAGVLLVAGCGSAASKHSSPANGTLQALSRTAGVKTVALIAGDADFAPGPLRYSFLVIANDGRPVSRPQADVWIARSREQKPFQRTVARLESIGAPGRSETTFGVTSIYVAHLHTPAPGTYWVLARPRGTHIEGLGNVEVQAKSASPAVGAKAPASRTPTLADTGGRLAPLTTATHPDRALYKTSIAHALAAHEPFVVTFATPKFCTSRTCGPVVDVVSYVRKHLGHTRVSFIHVEVYAHNDPSRGYNRWMREWGLRSEPWVFLVGRDGRIKAKFEGSVSIAELRAAVTSRLLR